jgi:hypothetical protein
MGQMGHYQEFADKWSSLAQVLAPFMPDDAIGQIEFIN